MEKMDDSMSIKSLSEKSDYNSVIDKLTPRHSASYISVVSYTSSVSSSTSLATPRSSSMIDPGESMPEPCETCTMYTVEPPDKHASVRCEGEIVKRVTSMTICWRGSSRRRWMKESFRVPRIRLRTFLYLTLLIIPVPLLIFTLIQHRSIESHQSRRFNFPHPGSAHRDTEENPEYSRDWIPKRADFSGSKDEKLFQSEGVSVPRRVRAADGAGQAGAEGRRPVILCWVMTDPSLLDKTAPARDTWMSRCDIRLFMSSSEDLSFPTVGLKGIEPGRENIASKSKASWTYIHKHYLNQADFFIKADPDSYIMMDNLRHYLRGRDSGQPDIYGHALHYLADSPYSTCYVAGQAVVLTREALRRLVEVALVQHPECFFDHGAAEDLKTAFCIGIVGGRVIDTRDNFGRETFLPPLCPAVSLQPTLQIFKQMPWYKSYRPFGYCMGSTDCFSDRPVAFHCILADSMYLLDYFEQLINMNALSSQVVTSPESDDNHNSKTSYHLLSFNGAALCENRLLVNNTTTVKT